MRNENKADRGRVQEKISTVQDSIKEAIVGQLEETGYGMLVTSKYIKELAKKQDGARKLMEQAVARERKMIINFVHGEKRTVEVSSNEENKAIHEDELSQFDNEDEE